MSLFGFGIKYDLKPRELDIILLQVQTCVRAFKVPIDDLWAHNDDRRKEHMYDVA